MTGTAFLRTALCLVAGVSALVAAGVPDASSRTAPAPLPAPLRAQMADLAQDSFPHMEHQGLFPLCQGCHEGIEEDEGIRPYPEAEQCTSCHDGVDYDEVDWSPPEPRVGILSFSHVEHLREVADEGDEALRCASCHVAEGGVTMEVVPLDAAGCLDCHGDPVDAHFEPGLDCASCHNEVAAAWDGERRVREGPAEPLYHQGRDFLLEDHGSQALEDVNRCATCHVEDQCASCHVDATLAPIPQVPGAPRDWAPVSLAAEYPIPDDHEFTGFMRDHGWPAPASQDCSTCHTQDDCASCHLAPLPPVVDTLEKRPRVRAPGAMLEEQLPASHDTPFFLATHPVLAAAGPSSCNSCHTQAYCAECHDAPVSPGYHPPSFGLQHAAATSTQVQECSNCHSAAVFCRECHVSVGLESSGRLGAGFHDAEPVWLLRHGAAARQGMEQCASCHEQRDCLQCHSTIGAFSVSPHGPDFNPELARSRNPLVCRACHIGGVS